MSYVLKRLIYGLITLWGAATLVFLLLRITPADPVELILGENAQPAQIQELRSELGLDRPIYIQYITYLKGLTKADLGRSILSRERVSSIILSHLSPTIYLALISIIFTVFISFPLGLLASLHRRFNLPASFFSTFGLAIPNFWLGPILILVFSVQLRLFPVSGVGSFEHYILPAVTLSTGLSAYLTRIIKKSLEEEKTKGYYLALLSRGFSKAYIFRKHLLPNAMIPIITVIGLQTGALLTGAIVTERIFSIPGIGSLLIKVVTQRDYPVVQGVVLFISSIYILTNLFVDLIYSLIDPRIRVGGKVED